MRIEIIGAVANFKNYFSNITKISSVILFFIENLTAAQRNIQHTACIQVFQKRVLQEN